MAKNNNTLLIIALVVGAFFLMNNPTGNYVSNYHPSYDTVSKSCPQVGRTDCYNDNEGWWVVVCGEDKRWHKQEFCATLRAHGDRSCVLTKSGFRRSTDPTVAKCRSPIVPKEGSPNYFTYTSPQ